MERGEAAASAVTPALFWQLTIDANDPVRLAAFWAGALGYVSAPPPQRSSIWAEHYRAVLADDEAFEDRIFDPEGLRPPLWFQAVPEEKSGKNRLHLDLYPTGRDDSMPLRERVATVDAKVDELLRLGAVVVRRTLEEDPEDPYYYVVMQDPEGNEFCVS